MKKIRINTIPNSTFPILIEKNQYAINLMHAKRFHKSINENTKTLNR